MSDEEIECSRCEGRGFLKKSEIEYLDPLKPSANNARCPLCSSEISSYKRFSVPKGFSIYGKSLAEIRNMMNFAVERGYKKNDR